MLFFCSLAGFAFAKLRFKGRNALMVIVILTLTVPNQLGVVALYILMGYMPGPEGGWNGHLLAVIVPSLVSAFGVFYMRQFILGAIPDELVESARVDGATTMRIYWSIVLPAIRPALAVLGLLTFVATWNDFQWPLITLGGTDMPDLDGGPVRPGQRQLRALPAGAGRRVPGDRAADRPAVHRRSADRPRNHGRRSQVVTDRNSTGDLP